MPGRRPKVSAFEKLPVELILDIMGHTASDDLKNLIRTEKFMNKIFKRHKTCIFKRIQRYQYPEFLEWFGERAGFDGPVSGDSRTSEQAQCLKEVVLSFNWRAVVSTTSGGDPSRLFLHLLERYGGWRYLFFLKVMKHQMEIEAQHLHESHGGKLGMTGEQAKAMVMCLCRMSWNPAVDFNTGMSEVDRIAEVRMRVEDRLKFFRREPPALQQLMTGLLKILTFCIVQAMRLDTVAMAYLHFYLPVGMASLTMEQRVAGWEVLVSKIMAKTLLGGLFYFGVTNVMRFCEEPLNVKMWKIKSVIFQDFRRQMVLHLQAVIFGTVPQVDSSFLAGSLWAAGLDFPTVGWFFIDRGGWVN